MNDTVLLIEDDPIWAKLVQMCLEAHYSITIAGTLGIALGMLRERQFDAVLCDLRLPDSRANDTMSEVKAAARESAIVAMSGYADEDTIRTTIEKNASGFIVKGSVDPKTIAASVETAILANRACHMAGGECDQ